MKDILSRYYNRVARQGMIRAVMVGAIISLAAMFVTELILFILDVANLYWIGIIVFAVLLIVLSLTLYIIAYRPDEKTVALRLDELGADERFVTALECENVSSTVAKKQRENTVRYAETFSPSAIKIIIPALLIVLLVVAFVLGAGSTTYVALADRGITPDMNDIAAGVDDLIHEDIYYTVVYEEYDLEDTVDGYAVGDGYIVGETIQIVKEGEDCLSVYAEAMDGSAFYMWSDGVTTISRTDTNILGDQEIYAIFVEVEDQDGDDGDGDGEAGEGDSADGDSSAMGEETSQGDSGEGEGSKGDGQSSEGAGDDEQGQGAGSGAGSGSHGNTNVKDNETDYRDEIDGAVEDAGEKVNGNGNYSEEERSIVDDYFDGLH